MNKNQKLITWKQCLIFVPAGLAGIGFFLYRQYAENGVLARTDWLIAGITMVTAAIIIGGLSWWGNKPEE